jgi:DNA-binding PadR family transcriptional regulator
MPIDSFDAEYATLGFLLEEPQHGYALRDRLKGGLVSVWHVASSQLYTVLRRLEDRGWVRVSVERSPRGPTRRRYAPTAAGREAFWAWCRAPCPHLRDARVELFAKLYFLRRLRPDGLAAFLDAQRDAWRGELERIADAGTGLTDDPRIGTWAEAYRRGQLRAAIEWLDGISKSEQEEACA